MHRSDIAADCKFLQSTHRLCDDDDDAAYNQVYSRVTTHHLPLATKTGVSATWRMTPSSVLSAIVIIITVSAGGVSFTGFS